MTHMHVIAVLICYNQQSPEGVSVLDLHGLRGVQHGEAAHAGHKGVAQHAHPQQGGDADGGHKPCQAQVHHRSCSHTRMLRWPSMSASVCAVVWVESLRMWPRRSSQIAIHVQMCCSKQKGGE